MSKDSRASSRQDRLETFEEKKAKKALVKPKKAPDDDTVSVTKQKNKEPKDLQYDKIRYPGYKELVYRKKNQELLPNEPTKVQKMIGYGGPLDMGGNQDKAPPENKTGQLIFDTDFECGNIDQVR